MRVDSTKIGVITKRCMLNGKTAYLVDTSETGYEKFEDRMFDSDYIVVYEQENQVIFADSSRYTNKEYYSIIKALIPEALVVNNMLEIGFSTLGLV